MNNLNDHPTGDTPNRALVAVSAPVAVDSFGGRVHVEWDPQAAVTPLGQLPFFAEYLQVGGLFDPWVEDVTVKPLYGHQEGAVVGYNPHKPGRPSHTFHTYFIANLRLVLDVEVQAGNQSASKYSSPGLWELLGRIPRTQWPAFIRGDRDWGTQPNMARAELTCHYCCAEMKIIAFVTETPSVRAILKHIGEPILSPARGLPAGKDAPLEIGPDYDLLTQPAPEIEFDQTLQW